MLDDTIHLFHLLLQFKFSQQHILVVKGFEANTNILCILLTEEGKSIYWKIPAVSNAQEYSIMIVPFVALIKDQFRHAQKLNIKATQFTISRQTSDDVTLLFVS